MATNASHLNGNVGVGVWNVSLRCGLLLALPPYNFIFSDEAFAVCFDLYLVDESAHDVVLLSLSLSVLSSLQLISRPTVIIRLYDQSATALQWHNSISLIWVPGHVRIEPNERTDSVAKLGSSCLDRLMWSPSMIS